MPNATLFDTKVVRNATNTYLDYGEYTVHPNWPEIRARLNIPETKKEVDRFFKKVVPAMSDAELIKLVEEA